MYIYIYIYIHIGEAAREDAAEARRRERRCGGET